jgi:hypothetical protein
VYGHQIDQIAREFAVISQGTDGRRPFLRALSEGYPRVYFGQLAEERGKMDDSANLLNVISIKVIRARGGEPIRVADPPGSPGIRQGSRWFQPLQQFGAYQFRAASESSGDGWLSGVPDEKIKFSA